MRPAACPGLGGGGTGREMDKLTIISGCLFLAADIFAIASIANPDWTYRESAGEQAAGARGGTAKGRREGETRLRRRRGWRIRSGQPEKGAMVTRAPLAEVAKRTREGNGGAAPWAECRHGRGRGDPGPG